ncbi:ankyrin repeat and SOCS box protein 3-like isoform X2 [Watersipora subatra]|uniref:ankyrin repeat and SOCS box protein 3-like isoform X2 n=1 Tax=Watersipora subatra TaxID=2589382 RepID=UPI00355BFD01
MCGRRKVDDRGRTDLINAVRHLKYDEIRRLLQQDVSMVDEQDHSGKTALHYAAMSGFCIELLLEYDPYIDMEDNNGNTPLLLACAEGRCRIIQLFITAGADMNKPNVANKRPITLLTQKGHVQCTDIAVKRGARLGTIKEWKEMIELALLSDKDDMVEYLLGITGGDILGKPTAVESLVEVMNLHGVEYYMAFLISLGISRCQLKAAILKRAVPEAIKSAQSALGTVMSLKECCRIAIRRWPGFLYFSCPITYLSEENLIILRTTNLLS